MEVGVVDVFPFQDFEEVPHRCGPERGECLPGDGDDRPGVLVLVTELDDTLEYRVRLPAPCAPLVDLDPGGAAFDVVVGRRLFQLTSALSSVNQESGFFSATAISWRSTYPRSLPLVFR